MKTSRFQVNHFFELVALCFRMFLVGLSQNKLPEVGVFWLSKCRKGRSDPGSASTTWSSTKTSLRFNFELQQQFTNVAIRSTRTFVLVSKFVELHPLVSHFEEPNPVLTDPLQSSAMDFSQFIAMYPTTNPPPAPATQLAENAHKRSNKRTSSEASIVEEDLQTLLVISRSSSHPKLILQQFCTGDLEKKPKTSDYRRL